MLDKQEGTGKKQWLDKGVGDCKLLKYVLILFHRYVLQILNFTIFLAVFPLLQKSVKGTRRVLVFGF